MPHPVRRLVPVAVAALASCQHVDPLCACTPAPDMTISPPALNLTIRDSAAVIVTVHAAPERATIRLATQDPSVARVDSVARSGVPVMVRAGVSGATVLQVTVTRDGVPVTGAVPVTVVGIGSCVVRVSLTPAELTLPAGARGRFRLESTNGCGAADTVATWASRDTTVAVVDSAGTVTARRPGQTTIAASLRSLPSLTAVGTVTVRAAR